MGTINQSNAAPDQTTTNGSFNEATRVPIEANSVSAVLLSIVATNAARTTKASWETTFVVARGTGDVSVPLGLIEVLGVQKDAAAALWDVDLLEDGSDVVVRVKGTTGVTVHWAINGQLYGCLLP